MPALSVAALIEREIAKGRKRLVSVPDVVYSIRHALPACEHTDEELAILVAMVAVQRGCDVRFGAMGPFVPVDTDFPLPPTSASAPPSDRTAARR